MSEDSTEPVQKCVNIDEKDIMAKQKQEPKVNKSLSNLAKEAEAILKGFGDREEIPEGRRATRSSTRGASITPVSTPPPIKKEKKTVTSGTSNATTRSNRRGRPKKLSNDDTKTNDEQLLGDDKNSVEVNNTPFSKESSNDEKRVVDTVSEENDIRNAKENESENVENIVASFSSTNGSATEKNYTTTKNTGNEVNSKNDGNEISAENEALEKNKTGSPVSLETSKLSEKVLTEDKSVSLTPDSSSKTSIIND